MVYAIDGLLDFEAHVYRKLIAVTIRYLLEPIKTARIANDRAELRDQGVKLAVGRLLLEWPHLYRSL